MPAFFWRRLVAAALVITPLLPAAAEDKAYYRSSASRPADAFTVGSTGTRTPDRTHARWLGAKRGANSPSLISRVTAKRLNTVGGRNRRSLFGKPSVAVSMSP